MVAGMHFLNGNAAGARAQGSGDQYETICRQITGSYESSLFSFEPDKQRHWAERRYRMTGDNKYIAPIIYNLLIDINDLRSDIDSLSDQRYLKRRYERLLDEFNRDSRKGGNRYELFKDQRQELWYLNLLEQLYRLKTYHVEDDLDYLYRPAYRLVKEHDFTPVILDTSAIKVYGAQLANSVYYLYFLDLGDQRHEFQTAFQSVFPDTLDSRLSQNQFRDKLYVLTHIMIAASQYYQSAVDRNSFEWILDYFRDNWTRIKDDASADIIAEIGICFLLAKCDDDPRVSDCRDELVSRYDRDAQLIPSPSGNVDLELGEHRNILAVMLLCWPGSLHEGPHLDDFQLFKDVLGN